MSPLVTLLAPRAVSAALAALGQVFALAGPTAPPIQLVGAAGTLDAPILVGSGGEIIERTTTGFGRRAGGGVATQLLGVGGPAPAVGAPLAWAVGARAPAYAWTSQGWSALPLRIGAVELADGAQLALAAGKKIAVRGPKEWSTLGAPGDLAGLWAGAARDLIAVTRAGEAFRFAGRWRPLKLAGRAERWADVIDAGNVPVLIAGSGALARVDAKGPRRLELPATWAGARVRLGARGAPMLLVEIPGKAGVPAAWRLGRIDGVKVVDLGVPPGGGPDGSALLGAPVALLGAADGRALVITREGPVHARDAAGAWVATPIDPSPPSSTKAANPPALAPPR